MAVLKHRKRTKLIFKRKVNSSKFWILILISTNEAPVFDLELKNDENNEIYVFFIIDERYVKAGLNKLRLASKNFLI
jgi:hypothetical protein